MKTGIKIALAGLGAALALAAAGEASAASARWNVDHPRRAEVNSRLMRQNHRIQAERKEGDITLAQARAMHAEDRSIRSQEYHEALHNHGHITRTEQGQLNHEENGVSRQIGQ